MTAPFDIDAMRADMEAGTPHLGGWGWYGCGESLYLATHHGGRRFVMDFVRKGMRSAQPRFQIGGIMYPAIDELICFQVGDKTVRGLSEGCNDRSVYRLDVDGIDHPDARRIARVPAMEAEILRLTTEVERLRKAGDAMADKVENGLISDGVNLWDNARAALGEAP